LREAHFIGAQFVSVPLAEFSSWSGPLFGARAFRAFMRWAARGGEIARPDLDNAKRFVPLHEICLANHLWVAPGGTHWRSRVFRLLASQALVDPTMVRDLRDRASGMLRTNGRVNERAETLAEYSLRVAIPSIEVVGEQQLAAVLEGDRAIISSIARVARDRVTRVVNSSGHRRADLLVLPEWAVARAQLAWLFARSTKHQMLVIAGEAPSVHGGVYSNRLWTGLPLIDRAGHRACLVPPPREKTYLSPGEQSALQRTGVAFSTKRRKIPVYAWRGVTFASLICFEFADVRARERLRAEADVMTVSSWNTDWRYFAAAQEATTRDNYCLSLCVNTSQFPGTALMRPTRSAMAIAAAVHGSSDPTVVTRAVDMLPIVASRVLGRRPSDIDGLPDPTDGLRIGDYAAVPPTFVSS
jgi:hypothetical protein